MAITREKFAELRLAAGVTGLESNNEVMQSMNLLSYDTVVARCQAYIKANTTGLFTNEKDELKKDNMQRRLINDYVDKKRPRAVGYTDRETNLQDLKIDLYNTIVGYGKLTDIMRPSDEKGGTGEGIDEIRINDRTNIWIEKNGRAEQADIQLSEQELETLTVRLLDFSKKPLAQGQPIQNARTKEGYRVNMVHGSVVGGRNKNCKGENVAVIRKFNSKPMTAQQLIRGRTMSINMFKTLRLIVDSDSSFVVVGATGSGKTVTNGIILRNIGRNVRIFSIENPIELPLKKVDPVTGRVMNDVVQYEGQSKSDNPDSMFTVEKAIETALRQSPHWLILGEARTEGEFAAALTAGQTGHCFATTYHAESVEDALKRYLTAYMKQSQEPANLAMANICSALRFVISQQKLPDGTRKIMEIAEVFPPENLESVTPRINILYKYVTEEIIYNQEELKKGYYKVEEMRGSHKRVNILSEANQERWMQRGVSKDRFEFLTKPIPSKENNLPEEIEVYDGFDDNDLIFACS